MPKTLIVIPCFNEQTRLRPEGLEAFWTRPDLGLVLVNDGSTDGTGSLLDRVAAQHPGRVIVHNMTRNVGKAEAVRCGLRLALQQGAEVVGYFDADLSTPASEMLRLRSEMDEYGSLVVLGTRVALLGHTVQRHRRRHYVGRVFATVAAIGLGLTIYDTQCGAKLFRSTPALHSALSEPFTSRWAFDVELLGRLLAGADGIPPLHAEQIREVPLQSWHDVPGSKLRPIGMLRAGAELVVIAARLRAQGRK